MINMTFANMLLLIHHCSASFNVNSCVTYSFGPCFLLQIRGGDLQLNKTWLLDHPHIFLDCDTLRFSFYKRPEVQNKRVQPEKLDLSTIHNITPSVLPSSYFPHQCCCVCHLSHQSEAERSEKNSWIERKQTETALRIVKVSSKIRRTSSDREINRRHNSLSPGGACVIHGWLNVNAQVKKNKSIVLPCHNYQNDQFKGKKNPKTPPLPIRQQSGGRKETKRTSEASSSPLSLPIHLQESRSSSRLWEGWSAAKLSGGGFVSAGNCGGCDSSGLMGDNGMTW